MRSFKQILKRLLVFTLVSLIFSYQLAPRPIVSRAQASETPTTMTTVYNEEIPSTTETVYEEDTTPPVITITNPLDQSMTKAKTISGITEPDLVVKLYIDNVLFTGGSSIVADSNGMWTVVVDTLSLGQHTLRAEATDAAGNLAQSAIVTFTFDNSRPKILPNFIPQSDMTRVSVDTAVYFVLEDDVSLDATDLQAINQPISLLDNGNLVDGTMTFREISSKQVEVKFIPDAPLKGSTKYTVKVNPMLADEVGNYVFVKDWQFTTVGILGTEEPHGNYTNNVNICSNCHSTHQAKDGKLTDPKYQQEIDNYCNACHDGTAAPIPNNWLSSHKHDYYAKSKTNNAVTCAVCHNPHLTWTPDNPNQLQDYYIFDHDDPTNPTLPDNSKEQLCESCHEAEIKDDSRVSYKSFQYKKWNTATGATDDYDLCLSCHNGNDAVNIAVYYNDLDSGHRIVAQDGNLLAGYMPCAECHNSHGSDNLKLLKDSLGHDNPQSFSTNATEWDIPTERAFCTRCHNNNTEVSGVVAKLPANISAHQPATVKYCHDCHGGSPIAAAHAPVKPD